MQPALGDQESAQHEKAIDRDAAAVDLAGDRPDRVILAGQRIAVRPDDDRREEESKEAEVVVTRIVRQRERASGPPQGNVHTLGWGETTRLGRIRGAQRCQRPGHRQPTRSLRTARRTLYG